MTPPPITEEKVTVRAIFADRAVRTIMGVVFVLMFGVGAVFPILPLFARAFGVGYGAAGFLVSAFAIARLVFDLVAGPIIDRYGERLSASGGMLVVALCSFLTGLAPNYWAAVVAWGAGGAGSAIVFAAFYSYLLKAVAKDRMARTLGIFYGAFNAGIIGGGFLGGVLAQAFGLASPLFLYAVFMLAGAALYLRFVPEPPPRTDAPAAAVMSGTTLQRGRAIVAEMLRIPGFITAIFFNLAYLWMVAGVFDTLVPLMARDELGMSTIGIGGLFAVALAAEFVVLYPAGTLADQRGRRFVMIPALAALGVASAVLGLATSPLMLAGLMALLGLASGFAGVPPAAILSDVTPENRSGTGVGIFRFCGDLGLVLGPVVGGVAASAFGFTAAFAISAIPTVVALALAIRTPETLGRGDSQSDAGGSPLEPSSLSVDGSFTGD